MICGLPDRVAQVTHALLEASHAHAQAGGACTPVRTSEVMIYDHEALTLGSTSSALARAMERRLADRWGWGLWSPTNAAWEMRRALEEAVLGDTPS
jgi:hypothetical protein